MWSPEATWYLVVWLPQIPLHVCPAVQRGPLKQDTIQETLTHRAWQFVFWLYNYVDYERVRFGAYVCDIIFLKL